MFAVLALLFTIAATTVPQVKGQFFEIACIPIQPTWTALEAAIRGDQSGIPLCSFTIEGDGCPSEDEYPLGIVVESTDFFNLVCAPDSNGFNFDTECVINCPGRHFTIRDGGRLGLRDVTLAGATNSSVVVEEGGNLQAIGSVFRE